MLKRRKNPKRRPNRSDLPTPRIERAEDLLASVALMEVRLIAVIPASVLPVYTVRYEVLVGEEIGTQKDLVVGSVAAAVISRVLRDGM